MYQVHSLGIPVIVAEIGVQCVDVQEQCHGAAHQLCDHLSKRKEGKEMKEQKDDIKALL